MICSHDLSSKKYKNKTKINFQPPCAVIFKEMYSARVAECKYVAKTSLLIAIASLG